MEKVIIALEWEKYLYLYKYNSCLVAQQSFIDIEAKVLQDSSIEYSPNLIDTLEKSLPIFERDMDVVLLEYDKNRLTINAGLRLSFNGVHQIIPLSEEAHQMLSSRVPLDITVSHPLSKAILYDYYDLRRSRIRKRTIDALLDIYDVPRLKEDVIFIETIHKYIEEIGRSKANIESSSILYNLLSFDITPSFIPEGNIESIIKIGCVVYKSRRKDIENIRNGDFFQVCKRFEEDINMGTILDGYNVFKSVIDRISEKEKSKVDILFNEVSKDFPEVNSLLVYYFYFSINRKISKQDFDLTLVNDDLVQLGQYDIKSLYYVLTLIGSVHSFERLYDSIHRLNKAPLVTGLNRKPTDKVTEKNGSSKEFREKGQTQTDPNNPTHDLKKSEEITHEVSTENKEMDKVKKSLSSKYDSQEGKNEKQEKANVVELSVHPEDEENANKPVGNRTKDKNTELEIPFGNEEPVESNPKSEYNNDIKLLVSRIENEIERKSTDEKNLWAYAKALLLKCDRIDRESIELVLGDEKFRDKKGKLKTFGVRIQEVIDRVL